MVGLAPVTAPNLHRNSPLHPLATHSQRVKIMPSKMDVAPWDKHWIKREFYGFGLYSMVLLEIQWYSKVFIEIHWYSMVFVEIQWYSMVFIEIQ